MKPAKMKLALMAVCSLLLLPQASEAAVKGVAMTDNTALFLINFDFLAGKENYRVPIGAMHGLAYGATSSFAGYEVFKGDKKAAEISDSNGIVLSNLPVVEGKYYEIKAGERGSFTLVNLVTISETAPSGRYHTELTHLPYWNGATKESVTPARLPDFASDAVMLNKVINGGTYTLQVK